MKDLLKRTFRLFWEKISPVWATMYGKTLIGFVFVQVVVVIGILIFSVSYAYPFGVQLIKWDGIERFHTTFLAVCVNVLVAFNTVIFLEEASLPSGFLSELKADLQDKFNSKYRRFRLLLIASVVASAWMTACLILFAVFSEPCWTVCLMVNEGWMVLLFSFFWMADLWCLEACAIALEKESGLSADGNTKVASFRNKLNLYLLASDGPGLLGMLLICTIGFLMHMLLNELYWQGFITGAIGLHIAFSQATLAFLSAKTKTE